jgi:hypothetical protein
VTSARKTHSSASLGWKPRAQDKIEAAKNVVMMDLALLSAEVANGMYKKPIEVLAREIHYDPLPDEVRTVLIAARTRGVYCRGRQLRGWCPSIRDLELCSDNSANKRPNNR